MPVNEPVVSVVTPTYNHGRFIGRCIESLLAQTYSKWQQVIVDDGSTDDTADIVRSYRDPRIRYMYQQNRGVRELAATMNAGLGETTGSLVTMLASDDTWPSYRLERQVPLFDDPAAVLCFGRGLIIDEDDNVLGEIRGPKRPSELTNRPVGSALRRLLLANGIFQPSELLRRTALDKIGGYRQPPGVLAEDYPTHLALASVGEFRYLDMILGNYRLHRSQMTQTNGVEMLETDMRFVLQFFATLDPETQQQTGWTSTTLAHARMQQVCEGHFHLGRRALLAADFEGARTHFVRSIRRGAPKTKIKALCGLVFSLAQRDLEPVMRLTGRSALPRFQPPA